MKFICAPDSFKGTLSSEQAARAIAAGIRQVMPDAEIELCPIGDGGEGTAESIIRATGGRLHDAQVLDPLGRPIVAQWGELPRGDCPASASAIDHWTDTAVLDMASASGLTLLAPGDGDPMRTTTFGTGQLIRSALDNGARHIIVGVGGSATCDGGTGCAQALGVRFLDRHDELIIEPLTGQTLDRIAGIDLIARDPRLSHAIVQVACDVTNPFHGPDGAARVYAPQKGASAADVDQLDANLAHLASRIQRETDVDLQQLPGSGAAGGLAGGMASLLGAKLMGGIDLVLDAVRFDHRVAEADHCVTGEGKLDAQSMSGKAVMGVARRAGKQGVPTTALVGCVGQGAQTCLQPEHGLKAYHVIDVPTDVSHDAAMRDAAHWLTRTAAQWARTLCDHADH